VKPNAGVAAEAALHVLEHAVVVGGRRRRSSSALVWSAGAAAPPARSATASARNPPRAPSPPPVSWPRQGSIRWSLDGAHFSSSTAANLPSATPISAATAPFGRNSTSRSRSAVT
jgi:hypothetical protein